MGVGTTPSALVSHGIDTTVVEIDPAVTKFAQQYFGLRENRAPIVQDATIYAADAIKSETRYDFIVHDVFTGGAEPVDLFTLEFLTHLHTLLQPNGVIAIACSSRSPRNLCTYANELIRTTRVIYLYLGQRLWSIPSTACFPRAVYSGSIRRTTISSPSRVLTSQIWLCSARRQKGR